MIVQEAVSYINDNNENHVSTQPNSNKSAVVDSSAPNHYLPAAAAGSEKTWGKLQFRANALSASNNSMPVLGTKTMSVAGFANVRARILKDLQDPLISVPRLCSNGYTVIFNKHEVRVHDADGKVHASGDRDPGSGGLYKLPVTGIGTASAEFNLDACYVVEEQPGSTEDLTDGIIYYMPNLSTYYGGISFKSKAERVSFYHAALGFPTVSGLVAALRSHFKLPGISGADVLANPPKTESTAKGHLRQHLKGVRSTIAATNDITAANHDADVQDSKDGAIKDAAPNDFIAESVITADDQTESILMSRDSIPGDDADEPARKTNEAMMSYVVGKLSADTTGKLQINSVMGHSAVHVSYIQSANYIRLNPIKNRTEVNDVLTKMYNEANDTQHSTGTQTEPRSYRQ